MKNIFVRAGKLPTEFIDPISSMRLNTTATNVGNMLFQQSVIKSLWSDRYKITISPLSLHPDQADWMNANCDLFVVPYANAFRPGFNDLLNDAAALIERLKMPVVVVGVGCQTDLDYNLANLAPIEKSAKRFLSAVSDRSASIGVRGACTAEYVRSLGYNNVEIIGCPSMFMDGPTIVRPRKVAAFGRATKLAVNTSAAHGQAAFSTGLDKMGRLIDDTVNLYDDVEYIPQENTSTIDLLLSKHRENPEHHTISAKTYERLRRSGRIAAFVDPRTWVDHLRQRDFVFGTRLHGGIAGLLAGTPAHLIAHDSRTLELAEYFNIPHTSVRGLRDREDAQQIYERSDYSAMIAGHQGRFSVYSEFLHRNGLDDVYATGENGRSFEAALADAELAPIIRPSTKYAPTVLKRRFGNKLYNLRRRLTKRRAR